MRLGRQAAASLAMFVLLVPSFIPTASAGASKFGDISTRPLPHAAWKILQKAHGIRIGGTMGAKAEIQIIFDANCPYCARLYEMLETHFPNTATRWVPVASLTKDSGPRAAAILASANPTTSLSYNFRHYYYGYTKSHGGYLIPQGRRYTLNQENKTLKKYWEAWGGFTPMIIFRDKNDHILRSGGASLRVLQSVLTKAKTQLPTYKPKSHMQQKEAEK